MSRVTLAMRSLLGTALLGALGTPCILSPRTPSNYASAPLHPSLHGLHPLYPSLHHLLTSLHSYLHLSTVEHVTGDTPLKTLSTITISAYVIGHEMAAESLQIIPSL